MIFSWLIRDGLALGVWALGGFGAGWLASGGLAVAWKAACGGMAVARDYAVGGSAFAMHANDTTAHAFVQNEPFYALTRWLMDSGAFQTLCWLPMLLVVWHYLRTRKMRREAAR